MNSHPMTFKTSIRWIAAGFALLLAAAPARGAVGDTAGGTSASSVTNIINSIQLFTNANGIIQLTTNITVVMSTNLDVTGRLKVTQSTLFTGAVTNQSKLEVQGTASLAGATNNGSLTNAGNIYNTGSITNGTGLTNGGPMLVYGSILSRSNMISIAGQSASNTFVVGIYYWSTTSFTNLNAAGTMSNLANTVVAANALTNNGDTIRAYWGGTMPAAAANTNQFQIVYGSQTILDTGLQIASNCAFRAEVFITRTGNTGQHVEGRFEWGPGGGVPFAITNSQSEIVQTNGIATTLALKGGARAVGAHTNNSFRVYYEPAVN